MNAYCNTNSAMIRAELEVHSEGKMVLFVPNNVAM